jgi:hypothetical protein
MFQVIAPPHLSSDRSNRISLNGLGVPQTKSLISGSGIAKLGLLHW